MPQSESLSQTEFATSRCTAAGRRLQRAVFVGIIGVIAIAIWVCIRPSGTNLPPSRDESAARETHSYGYSMDFPQGSEVTRHFFRNPLSGRLLAHPQEGVPWWRMAVEQNLDAGKQGTTSTETEAQILFQGQPATLMTGFFRYGFTFRQNIELLIANRSLQYWAPKNSTVYWHINFKRHGSDFRLSYTEFQRGAVKLEDLPIPPEVMSYFETFEYTPPEPSNDQQ